MRIFERMTGYAIYRIAETIRVLLFMTASILIFNFYPVTAIMQINRHMPGDEQLEEDDRLNHLRREPEIIASDPEHPEAHEDTHGA